MINDQVRILGNGKEYFALVGMDLVPITGFYDINGDECALKDATSAVAGPTKDNKWLSISLRMGPAPKAN